MAQYIQVIYVNIQTYIHTYTHIYIHIGFKIYPEENCHSFQSKYNNFKVMINHSDQKFKIETVLALTLTLKCMFLNDE